MGFGVYFQDKKHPPQLSCIFGDLALSEGMWRYLAVSGCIWWYLVLSGGIRLYLAVQQVIWRYLAVSILVYLGVSGRIWAHLSAFGRIWTYLGVSGRIWAYLSNREFSRHPVPGRPGTGCLETRLRFYFLHILYSFFCRISDNMLYICTFLFGSF